MAAEPTPHHPEVVGLNLGIHHQEDKYKRNEACGGEFANGHEAARLYGSNLGSHHHSISSSMPLLKCISTPTSLFNHYLMSLRKRIFL